MDHFKVDVVVHGMESIDNDSVDAYKIPKELGKFKIVDSGNQMSTITIVDRIINNAREFRLRNLKKEKKEIGYLKKQLQNDNSQIDAQSNKNDQNNNQVTK